jgi:hypothetical protein
VDHHDVFRRLVINIVNSLLAPDPRMI